MKCFLTFQYEIEEEKKNYAKNNIQAELMIYNEIKRCN